MRWQACGAQAPRALSARSLSGASRLAWRRLRFLYAVWTRWVPGDLTRTRIPLQLTSRPPGRESRYFLLARHAARPRARLFISRRDAHRATGQARHSVCGRANLFHSARAVFGHVWPNYDFPPLALEVCRQHGWDLTRTRFYTGVPDRTDDAFWHHFWTGKLSAMGKRGVDVFSRSLRYRNRTLTLPDNTEHSIRTGEEKGIDVRIAVDVIRLALRREYDVALIFSQDQDLSEVSAEIREIAREQDRWIKVACACPHSPDARNTRAIERTDWIRIDRATYDRCLDRRDYRPRDRTSHSPG